MPLVDNIWIVDVSQPEPIPSLLTKVKHLFISFCGFEIEAKSMSRKLKKKDI